MIRLLVSSLAGIVIATWLVLDGVWFGPRWQAIVGVLLLVALARDVCLGVDERRRQQRRLSEGRPVRSGRAPGGERSTRLESLGRLLLGFAAFALIIAAASSVGRLLDDRIACDSFSFDADDAAAWNAPAAQRASYWRISGRQRLADGLIKCGTLERADRASVRVRLGKPENRDGVRPWDGVRSWYYPIGSNRRRRWFGTDPEMLVVRFDEADRVTGLEIYN